MILIKTAVDWLENKTINAYCLEDLPMKTFFTKHDQITARLKKMIEEKIESNDVKLPTEKNLSEMFGVSRGTVRKAMEKLVSMGILQKIAGSGTFIKKNLLTDRVFGGKSINIKTVVLVYDLLEITDFRYRIIRGVVKAANAREYDTAIASFNNAIELFREKFLVKGKKNIAMASCNFSTAQILAMNKSSVKIPYVALNDYRYQNIAEYAVLGNPWLECGLNYLSSIGHKKILVLHDSLTKSCIQEVTDTAKAVFKNTGVKFDIMIRETKYSYNRVVTELDAVFSKNSLSKPTAILCLNDTIAAWAITHLRSINIRVPDDVSILGTNDFDICESTNPRITTTSLDYDTMGEIALDMIEAQIEGKEIKKKLVYIPKRLIERDSCRKI
jgi:GntR family transcriptional regulator of arabinose operon